MVTLQLRQIKVMPGCRVDLQDVDWAGFQAILAELGDSRSTHISYNNQTLTIAAPLFKHEKTKVTLGDMIKVLLEEQGIDYDSSSSTTLSRYHAKIYQKVLSRMIRFTSKITSRFSKKIALI